MLQMKFISIILVIVITFSSLSSLFNFSKSEELLSGSVLYVGPTSTYKTISIAVAAASPGDTIIVENGTYIESVTINKSNINLVGNSSTDCIIIHNYVGSDWLTDYAAGINITASGVNITGFNITVFGNYTYGICLNTSSSSNAKINNNNISTMNYKGYGILLRYSINSIVINNNINTNESYGFGIYVYYSDNNKISNNTINTISDNAYGILVESYSKKNTLGGNIIDTAGQQAHGMYLKVYSNNTNLLNNTIITTGSSAHGILISRSNKTYVLNCTVTTNPTNGFGFKFDGMNNPMMYATITNSTITGASSGGDIVATQKVNITTINCIFSTVELTANDGGVLQVKNYLNLQVFYNNGTATIEGADVEITDNGDKIYATSDYGGYDPQTNSNGRLNNLVITDRWYIYNNTSIENVTVISVKKTIDRSWEEIRGDVNMSSSHTENFIASDIVAPETPAGVEVTRMPGTNTLKISWKIDSDISLDIINHTVLTNKTGIWSVLINVTHPQNWTLDENLEDSRWYFYKIRAWDQVGLYSGYSTVVSYFLTDITEPSTPANLSVRPALGGNEFKITWDKNSDDTIHYEIYWRTPITRAWIRMNNVTHPTNLVILSNDSLVNGTTYDFKIRAWDEVPLHSNFSSPVSAVHRDYVKPEKPMNLYASAISDSVINLTWEASSSFDVVGYSIFINQSDTGSGGPYAMQDQVNTLSYQFINLMENTTYFFVVCAVDEANNPSLYSNEAWRATLMIPPGMPIMDTLPTYTNDLLLEVTGNAELNTTIIVTRNNIPIGSNNTTESSIFNVPIILIEDMNIIKVRARDFANVYSVYSNSQTVILDTVSPNASAGIDIKISSGDITTFNASMSSDNYGIANYAWAWFDSKGMMVKIFGEENSYKFNTAGDYEVILTVTDLAGNRATDTLIVNVTGVKIPERPKVIDSTPTNNSQNVAINSPVSITFSISMNTTSVKTALSILPGIDYKLVWGDNDKKLALTFDDKLAYDMNYTLTITGTALATTGGILKDAPFILNFKTEKEIIIKSIIITSPLSDIRVNAGATIIVTGTTTGLIEGTKVSVIIGNKSETGTISANGSWSVQITVPTTTRTYTLEATAGKKSYPIFIIVIDEEKTEPDKKDKDNGIFGLGSTMDLVIILLIIIIIIIILLAALMKKKKVSKKEKTPLDKSTKEAVEEEKEGEEDLVSEKPPEEPPAGEVPAQETTLSKEEIELKE